MSAEWSFGNPIKVTVRLLSGSIIPGDISEIEYVLENASIRRNDNTEAMPYGEFFLHNSTITIQGRLGRTATARDTESSLIQQLARAVLDGDMVAARALHDALAESDWLTQTPETPKERPCF